MTIVSPFLTFPAISWWAQVAEADTLILDMAEHFSKMTGRNRYRISGSNNAILLSIPLEGGREQRMAMADVRIAGTDWQLQHWRTLVSVYSRTPYFFHYEPSLQELFEQQFEKLTDFNLTAMRWVMRQLKMNFKIEVAETFIKNYPPEIIDLRGQVPVQSSLPVYHQVFEDRIGFVSDLSILDLLFSCGPRAIELLRRAG
jgi:hypothetical protein